MIPVILLIVICFLIYRNVFNFAFLSYDDDQNILNNKAILNLDFYKIWTEAYYGMYIPITYSVWSVLSSLTSSPNAGLFHGLNLALHLMNGVLVFYLLREIQGLFLNAITGESQVYSFIGAVFFIGHPLQVETVAWVSCTRDLLSSTFALGTLLAFLNGKKVASLVLANIFYIFSLLCKPLSTPLALFLFLFELIILKKRFFTITFYGEKSKTCCTYAYILSGLKMVWFEFFIWLCCCNPCLSDLRFLFQVSLHLTDS